MPLVPRLEHPFADEARLRVALTHRSYAAEHPGEEHNERLELLGDAVVKLVTTEVMLAARPDWAEDRLSQAVHQLVDTATLASFGRALGLGAALRLGRGEYQQGGRDKDKILEDAFEAVIAAVYLDGGLPAARRVLEPLLLPRVEGLRVDPKHPKSRLLELFQAPGGPRGWMRELEVTGEGAERRVRVGVFVEDALVAEAVAPSKKKAEAEAASRALVALGLES